MQTKVTQAKKVKDLYECNQQLILAESGLTLNEYYHLQFETGYLFLNNLFPDKTRFRPYYERHAYNKAFWSWWIAEWKHWEHEFVLCFKNDSRMQKHGFFESEMQQMVLDGYVESSFQTNYQKMLQYAA